MKQEHTTEGGSVIIADKQIIDKLRIVKLNEIYDLLLWHNEEIRKLNKLRQKFSR